MTPQRFARILNVLNHRQPDMTVMMEDVHKLHNLSAILRTCDAVGIGEIHAVTHKASIRLAHNAASGATAWVRNRTHSCIDSAYDFLRQQGFAIVAAHVDKSATDFRQLDFTQPFALVVGAELDGLTVSAAHQADKRIRVPLVGMVESLNVSVAVALIMFEAQRQRLKAGLYKQRRLDDESYKRLIFEWAYPRIARHCRKHSLAYPQLGRTGDLIERLPTIGAQ